MHCASIIPDQVFLNSELLTRECLPNGVEVTRNGDKVTITLAHKAIIVLARVTKQGLLAYHIRVDFARILFNHSGRVIQSHEEILAALTAYFDPINKFITADSQDRALPGIVSGCKTYWSSLEVPFQIHDPKRDIFKQLSRSSHSKVRKPALYVAGETVSFKGAQFGLNAYFKDIQLQDRYHHKIDEEDEHVLRLEVSWLKKALVSAFNGQDSQRLQTFTFAANYEAFLEGMRGVRGAFHKQVPSDLKLSKAEQFILKLILRGDTDLTPRELVKTYQESSTNKRATAESLGRIQSALESVSMVKLADLFPDDAPLPSKNIKPKRERPDAKGQPTGKFFEVEKAVIPMTVNPAIRKAYSKVSFIEYSDFQRSTIYDNTAKSAMPVPSNLKFKTKGNN